MQRVTRSGVTFAAWELDAVTLPARSVEVIKTSVCLDSIVQGALAAADEHAAQFDDDTLMPEEADDWEDILELCSGPQSPLSSVSSSPMSSTPSSPSVTPHPSRPPSPSLSPLPPQDPGPSTGGIHKQRQKNRAVLRRQARRHLAAPHTPFDRRPNTRYSQKYREQPTHSANVDSANVPAPGAGAWIGRRSKPCQGRYYTLPELEELGCEVIEWNGRDPKLIVDAEGRIIAVLLGTPDDEDWPDVVKEAQNAFARARRSARRHGVWPHGPSHRRGRYLPLTSGASFGGGQKRLGNLRNSRYIRRLLRRLLRNSAIRRFAGFQSAGLAMYAPKLYRYYCRTFKALYKHHPELILNFSNSVFPAATFNCGPDAVTFDHLDHLNLSHGLCGITCVGDFNSKLGGHLHLKQLRLIIEFPSSASILIPSGFLDHGNTPIQPGETRHSFTQYAAGGLFRWVAYGYQSAKSLLATRGGKEAKDGFDGVPGERWRWALDLFSKYEELDGDRIAASR
ncbi:hypothetical protein B0H11DRAFT_2254143 [Mycena galericulata]|nr:hypothetical protein B0H11DRAFT_2254143 [Mycena galericulata]